MRLSLNISGFGPVAEWLDLVVASEAEGFDGVWFSEHVGFRDGIVPAAITAQRTSRMEVGVMGATPTTRHPLLLAMEVASLAESFPGRIRLQVGTGADVLLASIGGVPKRPLGAITALMESQRAFFAGEPYTGAIVDQECTKARLYVGPRDVPIDVLAIRPRMMELASNIGDGVSFSAGASLAYITDSVATVRKGEAGRRKDFRITAAMVASIASTEDAALGGARGALKAWSPEMLSVLAPDINIEDVGPIESWPDELVRRVAIVGCPGSLEEPLQKLAATGVDEITLGLVGDPDELRPVLRDIIRARDAIV